jgi:hypothetical protein
MMKLNLVNVRGVRAVVSNPRALIVVATVSPRLRPYPTRLLTVEVRRGESCDDRLRRVGPWTYAR